MHCLTGCTIGEVLGMVIGTAFGWHNLATIAVSVVLAFFFGYSLTVYSVLRGGATLATALTLAFFSDTISMAVMEVVDNGLMYFIPGAMGAGLANPIFWIALTVSMSVAGLAAYPANRYLIARGKGHAVVHKYH